MKKALSFALALVLCLSLTVSTSLADSSVYEESGIRVTNVIEVQEMDMMNGLPIVCKAPVEITLLAPIEMFSVSRDLGGETYEDVPYSSVSTYVGYTGKTIYDVGSSVKLTEAGTYSMIVSGDEMDTLVEAPPSSHNLGSSSYGLYQIFVQEDDAAPTDPQPTTPPAETIPASGTAKASTQTVTVDGKAVEFQMYALLDENGNGTKAQFSVGYDNASKSISVTTGEAYVSTGTEMTTPFSGDRSYTGGTQSIQVNGEAVDMTAITLVDDAGGGYNYFKLRDLGAALGFNVGYSNEQGVFIESDKPYAG